MGVAERAASPCTLHHVPLQEDPEEGRQVLDDLPGVLVSQGRVVSVAPELMGLLLKSPFHHWAVLVVLLKQLIRTEAHDLSDA